MQDDLVSPFHDDIIRSSQLFQNEEEEDGLLSPFHDEDNIPWSQLFQDHGDRVAVNQITLESVQGGNLDATLQQFLEGGLPDFDLHEHPDMKLRQTHFLQSMIYLRKTTMAHCPFCKERWLDTELSSVRGLGRRNQCKACYTQTQSEHKIRKFSFVNNLDPMFRHDHLFLPPLSQIATMMISPVHIYMRVYRIEGGGVAYKGQVLNVHQSNMPILEVFPLMPDDLPVVLIRKPGSATDLSLYKDFIIPVADIMLWLQFLKIHNPLFKDINLETSDDRCSQLATLSQESHGSILPHLRLMQFDNDEAGEPILSQVIEPTETPQRELGPETGGASGAEEPVREDFLHMPLDPNRQNTEREFIEELVNGIPNNQNVPLPWPQQGAFINDFDQPGLLSAAFPTLFPYGVGDPTNGDREVEVSMTDSMKYLLKYCIRFNDEWHYPIAEDDRFVHWAQNTLERHRAQSQRGVLIHRNEEFANLTAAEMQAIINEKGERYDALIAKMQAFNSNLNGTPQYLYKARKGLEAIMESEGLPTIWFTLSMADNHWFDLHSLLHRDEKGRTTEMPTSNTPQEEAKWRRKFIRKYPHIVDAFFFHRVQELIKYVFSSSGLQVEWHWYRIEYQGRGAPHAHGCLRLKQAPDLPKLAKHVLDGWRASKMLSMRYIQVQNDFTREEKMFDEWAHADCPEGNEIALADLQDIDVQTLKDKVKLGKKSQKTIVQFHDFLLATMHPNPPTDAAYNIRSPNTDFDPKTTTVPHPSSVFPLNHIHDPEFMEDLYCKSINAQSRHKHQAYCDKNHKKREQAKIDGKTEEEISAIECDCRCDYPKDIAIVTTLSVTESVIQTKEGDKLLKYKIKLVPRRNDRWLNSNMRPLMDVWGANMDVQSIT